MSAKTVKICNVSLGATERDINELFSSNGVVYVELKRDTEESQIAFVTFKDTQGAEFALLLSGATIVDLPVVISLDPDYHLPPGVQETAIQTAAKDYSGTGSALHKAEDMVSSMLAKGFILGKDAIGRAKNFDEKHRLTSTASAKAIALDKKIGLTERISAGTTAVSGKVREVDGKFQVSEKTRSAFAVAEQKVSSAGSVLMKNRYVFTGAAWVADTFSRVSKAAGDVGQKAKEKVGAAKDEENRKVVDEFARVHLEEACEEHRFDDDGASGHDVIT